MRNSGPCYLVSKSASIQPKGGSGCICRPRNVVEVVVTTSNVHTSKGSLSRSQVLVASQHPSDDILVYKIKLSNSGREVGFIHDNLNVRSLRCGSRCLEGCCSFHDVSSNTALMVLYSGMEIKKYYHVSSRVFRWGPTND